MFLVSWWIIVWVKKAKIIVFRLYALLQLLKLQLLVSPPHIINFRTQLNQIIMFECYQVEIVAHRRHQYYILRIWLTYKTLLGNLFQMT